MFPRLPVRKFNKIPCRSGVSPSCTVPEAIAPTFEQRGNFNELQHCADEQTLWPSSKKICQKCHRHLIAHSGGRDAFTDISVLLLQVPLKKLEERSAHKERKLQRLRKIQRCNYSRRLSRIRLNFQRTKSASSLSMLAVGLVFTLLVKHPLLE